MDDKPTSVMQHDSAQEGYTSVRGEGDPFSLMQFVGDALTDAINRVPDELLQLSEKMVKKIAKPTACDYALRVNFWREFERVMSNGAGKMVTARVFGGACTDGYFYASFLKNPKKVAWLIRPMQTYKRDCEAILHFGTERLKEAMTIPFKVKGKWQPKNVEIFAKLLKQVEDRVHGMAVQRTQNSSKSLKVVVNQRATIAESEAELLARLRQLEAEAGPKMIGDETVPRIAEFTVIDPDEKT